MELISQIKNLFIPEIMIMFFILINIIFLFIVKKHEYKIAKTVTVIALISPLLAYYTIPVSNIFSVASKIIILISALLILFASHNLLTEKRKKAFRFFTIFLCAILSALGLVTFNNLIYSFVSFVLFGIFSYLLIVFRNNERSKQAANLYRYTLIISSLLFLLGILFLYLCVGSTNIININSVLSVYSDNIYYLLSSLLIIFAFIIILGIIPLSNVAERICDLSASKISAYLTIIPVVAYVGFLSKYFVFVSSDNPLCSVIVASAMAITIFCCSFRLVKEENIKKIYSNCAIVSSALLIIAVTVCSVYSLSSVLFGLFAYIFTMAGLWSVSVILRTRYQSDNIIDYRGLFYNRPYFTLAYLFCIVSAMGLPPTGCFIARIYEFSALFKTDINAFYFIILLICLFSLTVFCFCFLRLVKTLFEKNDKPVSISRMFIIPKITLYLCSFVTLLLFVFPDRVIKIAQFIAYYI